MASLRIPIERNRLWLTYALAFALVGLAVVSVTYSLILREELRSQVAGQLESQLQDRVSSWEDGVLETLGRWQTDASGDPANAWLAEKQYREREAWFDSLYLWEVSHSSFVDGERVPRPARFLFPEEPPTERTAGVDVAPCLMRARIQANVEDDPLKEAAAYTQMCKKDALPVQLAAASQAAAVLIRAEEWDAAIAALDAPGFDADTSLRAGIQRGLDPARLVVLRLERADALMGVGKQDEALDLWNDTGLEICNLDAPEFDAVKQYVRQAIVKELRAHGRRDQATGIDHAFSQAERRYRAWREIAEKILPQHAQAASEAPRFVYDQFSDTPFLLYYGPVRDGEMGCALQIDQPLLLADFLGSMARFRKYVVVSDANTGRFVAGQRGGGSIVVEVPFRTLTHLRVGLRQGALEDDMAQLDAQWFVWVVPIVLTGICVILGFVALFAQVRADRQLQELLVRQREFTTRVTHELKTPLAGIRVMAENLESGAFLDERQHASMARSILQEADRLAQRVDEILSVARERKVPDPEPFDPEEAVLEAIDTWGPRLEQAGVRLHADLHPTDQVLGDAASIRDAVGCLLDNALKYHRDDVDEPEVWLVLSQDGKQVSIDVSDNGIGVPPRMRRQIFEKFVRVEGPNRGMAGGHGLGLAQVAEVVAAHRGTVECVDGVDGGARFVLRLPALPTRDTP